MSQRKTVERTRSNAGQSPAQQANDKAGGESRDEAAHSAGRPERVSLHNQFKLAIPPQYIKDGYHAYWFQDKDGRVASAKAAYYEHIVDGQGNNFTAQSGAYTMYAMQLPGEYREQDVALKKKRVADTLEAEATIGRGEYAPDPETGQPEGGQSALNRHR